MRLSIAVFLCVMSPAIAAAGDFFTLKGHGGPVKEMDVSPSGEAILTASFDYSLGYWNGDAAVWLEAHEAAVNAVVFVDETSAVSGGDDYRIILWDLEAGTSTLLGEHKGKIIGLAISPDKMTVASASWDGRIGLFPLDGGAPRFFEGHASSVSSVVFSDDGERLYSASADGTVRLWRVSDGTQLRTLVKHGWGVNRLVLNEASGWLAYGGLDGSTRVVSAEDGAEIADFTLDRRPILALAASPDFDQIAVGDGDGYIMVVDTTEWSIVRDFRATYRGPVWALHYSLDGENIHAGGLDDAMYSWPVSSLDEHGQMTTEERTFLIRPEEMSNGERQFQRKCSICHALGPDSLRRAGPTLYEVFGRPAGAVDDYSYSDTLENSDIIWSDETIDRMFDIGPDYFVPGTKMPMQRIVKPQDRADLIGFLRDATTAQGTQQ